MSEIGSLQRFKAFEVFKVEDVPTCERIWKRTKDSTPECPCMEKRKCWVCCGNFQMSFWLWPNPMALVPFEDQKYYQGSFYIGCRQSSYAMQIHICIRWWFLELMCMWWFHVWSLGRFLFKSREMWRLDLLYTQRYWTYGSLWVVTGIHVVLSLDTLVVTSIVLIVISHLKVIFGSNNSRHLACWRALESTHWAPNGFRREVITEASLPRRSSISSTDFSFPFPITG